MNIFKWIKKRYSGWKLDRLYKKRIEELKKRDPFTYRK